MVKIWQWLKNPIKEYYTDPEEKLKEENERPDENNILPSQRELLWTTHDHLYSWKASFASFAILGSHI